MESWLALQKEILSSNNVEDYTRKQFTLAQHLAAIHLPRCAEVSPEMLVSLVRTSPQVQTALSGTLAKTKEILTILLEAESETVPILLKDLADLCINEYWRTPAGEAGFLELATDVLEIPPPHADGAGEKNWEDQQKHALRLIGNLCAYHDGNRDRALQRATLETIVVRLADAEPWQALTLSVVGNICSDYLPAKLAAIELGVLDQCLEIMKEGDVEDSLNLLSLFSDVMTQLMDGRASEDTLRILLEAGLVGNLDIDARSTLLDLIDILLTQESHQRAIVENDQVQLVLGCLARTYTETPFVLQAVFNPVKAVKREENSVAKYQGDADGEDAIELARMRGRLVIALADISSLVEFKKKYANLDHPSMLVWELKKMIASPRAAVAQAACLMLGNLATSDNVCIELVRDVGLHQTVSTALSKTNDTNLLHAILSLLRNLALPSQNKEYLSTVNMPKSLERFWKENTHPQVQYAAAVVMRQMVNGCLSNIHLLLLMSDSSRTEAATIQSQMASLLGVYFKRDELAIKTEIARTITAILRCLYSKTATETNDVTKLKQSLLHDLYTYHPRLEEPLIGMIVQSQYPAVRSEGWFALGLMTREEAGKRMILNHTEALQKLFNVAVNGTNNGDTNTPLSKDRDNALIVAHELGLVL